MRSPRWPSALMLVAVNAVPVYGVIEWGWSAFSLLLLYWLESVLYMVFVALRALLVHPASLSSWLVKLVAFPFLAALVLLPYLGMAIGLAAYLFGVLAPDSTDATRHALVSIILSPSRHPNLLPMGQAVQTLAGHVDGRVAMAAGVLAASHLASFIWNFILGREYRRAGFQALMVVPLARIWVPLAVLVPALIYAHHMEWPALLLAALIGAKTAVDLAAHILEHRAMAAP